MSFLTYPLNYIDYDYEAAETWLSIRSSGVFVKNDFDYTVTNADTIITFGEGLAWIHNHRFAGKVFRNDENFALDFGVSDNVYDRIDVAAIQFDKVKNTTKIIAKHGVAQTNPVIPAIVQTEELYELYICSVSRKAGSAYITYEDIKDLRLSPQYCGLMADSVTEVDTEKIAAQIDAFIEDLKNKIKGIESGTATMLKSTYDTDNDGIVDKANMATTADNGIFVYTQSSKELTGTGTNGKFKATATGTYTAFIISGVSYAVKAGSETEIELTSGVWYSFILDTEAKTINFKAGGAGLNFTIVSGTEQPTSPKENTIWIKTDTAIGEYQCSATEPTTRVDGTALQSGDVWIRTGVSSSASFNALKKNSIIVCPLNCYQYINDEWIRQTAKSYIAGQWVDWILYLYKEGVLASDYLFVQGYSEYQSYDFSNNQITLAVTKRGKSLNGLYIGFRVDMTNFTKADLHVVSRDSTNYGYCGIVVTDTDTIVSEALNGYNGSTGYVSRVCTKDQSSDFTQSLDLTTLSGEYYIWFGFMIYHSNATGSAVFDEFIVS